MRSRHVWHRGLIDQLTPAWPAMRGGVTPGEMLNTELGLYLLEHVMPGRNAADAWTLFGGYPYAEAFGHISAGAEGDTLRLMVRRARHYLWSLRRRRVWLDTLRDYRDLPEELRGYNLPGSGAAPQRRKPSRAADRFRHYQQLLEAAPAFEPQHLPIAEEGEHWFQIRDRSFSVSFTADLLTQQQVPTYDLAGAGTSSGQLQVSLKQLRSAAKAMDKTEKANNLVRPNCWTDRLQRVELLVPTADGAAFEPGQSLTIDRLMHMVGMVGAGKSTLRDIVTYWYAKKNKRITVVVGDVAEALTVVETLQNLGVSAAPVLGHSTRERHIHRLHRRIASAGAPTMLAHEHSAFAYLNSACAVDALRGLEAARPLAISEAPCTRLFPATPPSAGRDDLDENDDLQPRQRARKAERHGCPLWSECPRHHASRELKTASVWVATPASLIHSGVPQHQTTSAIRYLELACRRSDLFIVDEADRVQMQLDSAFAPATTLVGRGTESWLDEVHSHQITELARHGRLQLSQQFIDAWINAFNTVITAADCLYGMLTRSRPLRDWITTDYFSAYTLHQWLLSNWFPDVADETTVVASDRLARRDRVSEILDAFRDQPLRPTGNPEESPPADKANNLVALTLRLLHARHDEDARQDLRAELTELTKGTPGVESNLDIHLQRFEFTLLLSALHHSLDFVTTLWPRVEASLNLDATSNVLSRRPPKDYEPIMAESPMGNVLGFQFQPDEKPQQDGSQSGSLRFFRCSGLGRDLLLGLHELPAVDGGKGPAVLLMSATSWAGTSSRYHINHPVGAILRPHAAEVKAILGTRFRKEFLYAPDGDVPLRLSGAEPHLRPTILLQMLRQLAEPDRSLSGATSKLADELDDIEDPDRRRILILVGSYAEAKQAGEFLNGIPEWNGSVSILVSDDTDLDDSWQAMPHDRAVRSLRRGDVAAFPRAESKVLIAPLLAVERGHNIVLPGGKAAIGTVYFLARPHPRPDDISLAIQSINDWAVRDVRSGRFHQRAMQAQSPDQAGLEFRRLARKKWQRFLTRRMSWTSLKDDEKRAFAWDQLVVMWQVIGRLVRGGVPARVVFVDAAFAPGEASLQRPDTHETSLLMSIHNVLHPYFTGSPNVTSLEASLVEALYQPLYQALEAIDI